jgi:hypothetical protein
MKTKAIFHSALFLLVLFACSSKAIAQTQQENLTATILHLDSAFWKTYNSCDTVGNKTFFTDDVEFYHDKGGITLGAAALAGSLAKNLCSNVNYRLRREAVAGTVKVYPMQNGNEIYGAIITGEHVFYITQDGKPEFLDGAASFTHLWILKNGEWKMKRILSYNHHPAEYVNTRKEIEVPDKQLDQLAGTYKSVKFGRMSLAREGNVLILKTDKNNFTLYPQSATAFFTKERDLVFEFVKDANNKPVKMIVKEHGAVADELVFEK